MRRETGFVERLRQVAGVLAGLEVAAQRASDRTTSGETC